MHSPLPDSSALEAGILEDERPSRLSQVHDNVRNLLRASVLGSVASSPTSPIHRPTRQQQHPIVPPILPLHHSTAGPEVLPSPVSTVSSSTTTSSTSTHQTETPPSPPAVATTTNPTSYRQMIHRITHQSALFNSRAVDALNHPDLSDPSLEDLHRHKTQHRQQRHVQRYAGSGSNKKQKKKSPRGTNKTQVLFCVLSAVLLAALVASYLALITTSPSMLTTTFHVLFILGILLATILFAHSLARLCVLPAATKASRSAAGAASRRHRRRHNHGSDSSSGSSGSSGRSRGRHHHHRVPPPLPSGSAEPETFIPANPIPVVCASDTAPAATSSHGNEGEREHELERGTEAALAGEAREEGWDQDSLSSVVHPLPPPAYGRWRGSMRANPELLHWAAVSSPATGEGEELPSPGYDEVVAGSAAAAAAAVTVAGSGVPRGTEGPPSYVTREEIESNVRLDKGGLVVVPEMVEVRGAGGSSSSLASSPVGEGAKVPWREVEGEQESKA